MKVNLNDYFVFGLEVAEKKSKTGYSFYSMGATESAEKFISFSQYLLDNFSGPDRIVIIHTGSQAVFDFAGVAETIGLKSKRGGAV